MPVLKFNVQITVNVHDSEALHAEAIKAFQKIGLSIEEAQAVVGTSTQDIRIEDCLIAVFDPGTPPTGTTIVATTVQRCVVD